MHNQETMRNGSTTGLSTKNQAKNNSREEGNTERHRAERIKRKRDFARQTLDESKKKQVTREGEESKGLSWGW